MTALNDCLCFLPSEKNSRRSFLKLSATAVGLGTAASLITVKTALAGHTEALLLSCMDYRLVDDIVRYMDSRKMTNKYDHVVLAGGSLGATIDQKPAWASVFWDHLDIAIKLHAIKQVLVLDHRDCGAYKVFLGKDYSTDAGIEQVVHADRLMTLGNQIKAKHKELEVELMLMALDGSVTEIARL